MKAFLILEDGTVFQGTSIGSAREVISEIVFNTSMTGYLEVLDGPVLRRTGSGDDLSVNWKLRYLLRGHGVCKAMAGRIYCQRIIPYPSNFRSEDTIQHFLESHDIPGISGIDTRALTKILREKGTMNGMITTDENYDLEDAVERMKAYSVKSVVMATTTKEKYVLPGDGKKVALLDLGAKRNIARSLNQRGCQVTVYPANTSAEEILAAAPDGIMLSNGPGDPKENVEIIREIRKLYESSVPIFAICLGHQLMPWPQARTPTN